MFDFKPDPAMAKPELYRQLLEAADALTSGEEDAVANMANVAALIWEFVPVLNWAGFYRMGSSPSGNDELVLGPFNGRPAASASRLATGFAGRLHKQDKPNAWRTSMPSPVTSLATRRANQNSWFLWLETTR